MVKCKKCEDGRDYEWDTVYGENTGKWRLKDIDRETIHECNGKKHLKQKEEPNNGKGKLWKKDWKPIMDVESRRVCGVCKTVCVLVTDCEHCEQFKMNPCNDWCPKCEKHPMVIYVEKDPVALEEFYLKHPEEKV